MENNPEVLPIARREFCCDTSLIAVKATLTYFTNKRPSTVCTHQHVNLLYRVGNYRHCMTKSDHRKASTNGVLRLTDQEWLQVDKQLFLPTTTTLHTPTTNCDAVLYLVCLRTDTVNQSVDPVCYVHVRVVRIEHSF